MMLWGCFGDALGQRKGQQKGATKGAVIKHWEFEFMFESSTQPYYTALPQWNHVIESLIYSIAWNGIHCWVHVVYAEPWIHHTAFTFTSFTSHTLHRMDETNKIDVIKLGKRISLWLKLRLKCYIGLNQWSYSVLCSEQSMFSMIMCLTLITIKFKCNWFELNWDI